MFKFCFRRTVKLNSLLCDDEPNWLVIGGFYLVIGNWILSFTPDRITLSSDCFSIGSNGVKWWTSDGQEIYSPTCLIWHRSLLEGNYLTGGFSAYILDWVIHFGSSRVGFYRWRRLIGRRCIPG